MGEEKPSTHHISRIMIVEILFKQIIGVFLIDWIWYWCIYYVPLNGNYSSMSEPLEFNSKKEPFRISNVCWYNWIEEQSFPEITWSHQIPIRPNHEIETERDFIDLGISLAVPDVLDLIQNSSGFNLKRFERYKFWQQCID